MSDTAKAHLKQIYNDIISTSPKYGVYHKTIFHIHTPESHDFKLVDEWEDCQYQSASFDDVMAKCEKQGVFPKDFDISSIESKAWDETYSSKKEWLSFVMLADALIKEQYAFVVVTDHNTISGIEKLKKAVKAVHSAHKGSVYPTIIAGIEISCADKLHVVVIFDLQKHKKIVEDWLDGNLINPKDGSYQTSLNVIDFFSAEGCLAYIAHINTSNIFGEKYLSGAYKAKLFTNENLNFFGVNKAEGRGVVATFLRDNFKIKNPRFLLDNDAHTISQLSNNYFWLKGSKPTYGMLVEALNDYTVSVCFEEEQPKQYIDGIFIESGGFLVGAKDSPTSNTIIRFSPGLNCFIGGRGTGKSTVLQMIDYILSQRVDSADTLDFLCEHGNTYILYYDNGIKYLIEMIMPIKKDGEHILKCFGQNEASRYGYFYHFDPVNVSEYARQKLLTIYKISGDKGDISFTKISKRAIVDKLYDTRYSVNRLVSTASSNEIQNFILELIFKNKILTDIAHIINARSLSGLRRIIKDFPELEQRRAKEIQDELRPFNEEQKGLLKIEYSQNAPIKPPNISEWMFNEDNPRGYFSIKGRKYNISKADIVEYVFYVLSKEGIMDFLTMMFEDSMTEKRYAHPVLRFSEQFTQKHVEEGISEITNENQANIIDEIYRLLSRERNVAAILHYLKYVAQHKERFSLYFNVNSSTTSNGTANYKDVRKLSLGQKVVAMLDLIFAYGKYANDFRPIVIDQPEDNLDSQYIYKNLVSQLRTIKKNRQVIIATHNATIVTNAMADQVCVMNSDGSHGWVERSGYPSEKAIKNSILNYLEGGKDSFKHKQQIYRLVLNE